LDRLAITKGCASLALLVASDAAMDRTVSFATSANRSRNQSGAVGF